jgi:hypothetical protein
MRIEGDLFINNISNETEEQQLPSPTILTPDDGDIGQTM